MDIFYIKYMMLKLRFVSNENIFIRKTKSVYSAPILVSRSS